MGQKACPLPRRVGVVELYAIRNPKDNNEEYLLLWVPTVILKWEEDEVEQFFRRCCLVFDARSIELTLGKTELINGTVYSLQYPVAYEDAKGWGRFEVKSILRDSNFSSVNFKIKILSRRSIADLFTEGNRQKEYAD